MPVNKGRGYVYYLRYHMVFCTKYRHKVIQGPVEDRIKEMFQTLAKGYIESQKKRVIRMTEPVKKAFKVRLYPTHEQQVQINKTTGCTRWVYNHFLAWHIEVYKAEKRYMSYSECSAMLTKIKATPGTEWLAKVDKFALQNSLKDLDLSYKNFFEGRAKYPKFKSKHGPKQSYQTNFTNNNIRLDAKHHRLRLPKIGWVKYAADGRDIPGDIINVTVSKISSGKYFASILCEVIVKSLPLKTSEVGIDLGLKKFAILSNDEVIENPRYYVEAHKKLVRLQRVHARKKKGSKNREKARLKVARQHEKVKNQRRDFQHKLSKRLVVENQVISMEDLRIKNMVKNRKLAKAVSDAGWSEFRRMIEYKAAWHGRTVVIIDAFYPSSKLCGRCGTKNTMLTLTDRKWQCPICRTVHDRDKNAAKNILAEGKRMLAS